MFPKLTNIPSKLGNAAGREKCSRPEGWREKVHKSYKLDRQGSQSNLLTIVSNFFFPAV